MSRRLSLLSCALFLGTSLLGACGTETSTKIETSSTQSDDFPVTIDTELGSIEIEERPENIVSLSPTHTEMLFAVGAGDQVVAVDDQSNFPPEAPVTELSGLSPNIEAIAGYEPDLVVAYSPAGLKRPLESLDIPLLVQPAAATLDDTYDQMEQLGIATGNPDDAGAAIQEMKDEIDGLVQSLPTFEEPPTYFHELDNTYYTATSDTFIGNVYGLLGLENIADEAKGAGTGYPQLSAEYIIDANPDLVFLADTKCCDQSASTVTERPGWDEISAVKNDAVIELDDDVASRWGPRIVDFIATVVAAVNDLADA